MIASEKEFLDYLTVNHFQYERIEHPAVFEGIRAYNTDKGPAVFRLADEVIGLSEMDFRTIGEGVTGPVTRQIQKVYHDAIRGRMHQYQSWCDYVEAGA